MRILLSGVVVLLAVLSSAAQEDRTQITTGNYRDTDPMISPDGNLMAFSSNRTGKFNIYVFSYRDSGTLQLTKGTYDDRYPNWSPDSKNIVFCSDRTGKGDIFRSSVTGESGFLQLTEADVMEEYPSVPPNGKGLVWARAEKKGLVRRSMNVVFSDDSPSGGLAVVLAEGDEPRFSPDGSKITFVSHRTKNNDVWVMNRDGSMQTQLTTDPKDDENPFFSPDGKRIVFSSKRTGNADIWVMDSDGTNIRQLTSDPADETQPCWSVGGYIYYTRAMGEGVSNIFRIKAPK
ncbi:MAG: PD40 domain-containing protein [Candidatus Hydrogenedentes bacterium]|nr:PD40 domain-containing protein [Candidatus Hydrogenedentota bacterium]